MTRAADTILRIQAVLARTALTRSTLYRKIKDGSFPRQIKISDRCAGWREGEVEAWLADPCRYQAPVVRMAERDAAG